MVRGVASIAAAAPPTGHTVVLDYEHFPVPPARSGSAGASKRHQHPSAPDGPASAAQNAQVRAVVIAHGLFGSKQNWRSLARRMAQRWRVDIYTLDLRNHGDSPHVEGMNYADMAGDVLRFLQGQTLSRVLLVGHSMGGKAVLATALSDCPPNTLAGVVSIDMSPARARLSNEFNAYLNAMIEIEAARVTTRHEADAMLARTEPSLSVRQFLLTNLERKEGEDYWSFRVPLDILQRSIDQLGYFPYAPGERAYAGRALFIKGAQSKYINHKNIPVANALFPRHSHVVLDTGHWVQAEKPHATIEAIERFMAQSPRTDADESR